MDEIQNKGQVPDLGQGDTCAQNGATGQTEPNAVTAAPGRTYLMTTPEAAAFLRKSVSWLLRQPDMPFLPGKPNLYKAKDLDAWVERHKIRPKVRA